MTLTCISQMPVMNERDTEGMTGNCRKWVEL